MIEPSAIWSARQIAFDKSLSITQNVILSHARTALQALIGRIDLLDILVMSDTLIDEFYIHPDIPTLLSDICFQHGIASTLLFDDSRKKDRES